MSKLFYQIFPYWVIGYYLGTTLAPRPVQMFWLASLYLLAFILLIGKWKKLAPTLFKDPWIISLIALAGMSSFWSVVPSITFAAFRSLIVQHIIVNFMVISYEPKKVIDLISKVLSWAGIFSLIYIVFLPQVGTVDGSLGSGAWYGIFAHQSMLAASMALAIISLFHSFLIKQQQESSLFFKISTILLILICLFLLLFCGAKTALSGLIVSFILLPFFKLEMIKGIRNRTFIFLISIYTFVIGIPLFFWIKDFIIVDIFGKSKDLTGRADTWAFVLEKVSERPLLGYGYGAFFHNKQIAAEFSAQVGRQIPSIYNTHNSYLDCLVGLGCLGMIPLIMFIVTLVWRNLVLIFKYCSPLACWNLQIITLLLIASYSDTFIGPLQANSIGWFLFSIISLLSRLQYKGLNTKPWKSSVSASAI